MIKQVFVVPIAVLPVFLLLVAAGVSGCQIGGPSRVEVPEDSTARTLSFELAGPGEAALIVPVHVNGQGPHRFVLDTGATLTCVDAALADTLALPERSGEIGFGAGVGGSGGVELVGIDSLRLGETKAFNMTACVLDLSEFEQAGLEIDGLLGLNFLRSFRVTLDFGDNTLHLAEL